MSWSLCHGANSFPCYRWSCAKKVYIICSVSGYLLSAFFSLVTEVVPLVDFGKLFLKQEHMVGGVVGWHALI